MEFYKDSYTFKETLAFLSKFDGSLCSDEDIFTLIKSGRLEVLLELINVKLLPISQGFNHYSFSKDVVARKNLFRAEEAFGKEEFSDFLRVYAKWVRYLRSSNNEISIYKTMIKGKTARGLTLSSHVHFAPLSIFYNSKQQFDLISENSGWSEYLKHGDAQEVSWGLEVDTPILVSPFMSGVTGEIYSYIPGFTGYDENRSFIKCHALGEDWLIVEKAEHGNPFLRLISDKETVKDAVKNGKLRVTTSSIKKLLNIKSVDHDVEPYLDKTNADVYAPEMDIAIQAHTAIVINQEGNKNLTVFNRVKDWLLEHYPGRGDAFYKRISTVANTQANKK